MFCARKDSHLLISYCGTHNAVIKDWFRPDSIGAQHHHLSIVANDGVQFAPFDDKPLDDAFHHSLDSAYSIKCSPVGLDLSKKNGDQKIDLNQPALNRVTTVVASNHSDTILGNDLDNTIVANLNSKLLSGRNGSDTYVINIMGGVHNIDNIATDLKQDTVMIDAYYKDIRVKVVNGAAQVEDLASGTKVVVVNYMHWANRHLQFITKDSIAFEVKDDFENASFMSVPSTIDLSSSNGGFVDLPNRQWSVNGQVARKIFGQVHAVLDSEHDDHIIGNELGNMLSCHGGNDRLVGNNGADLYKIGKGCQSAIIDNFATDLQTDVMFIEANFVDISLEAKKGPGYETSLVITNKITKHKYTLESWFLNPEIQHLMIHTLDGIECRIHETNPEKNSKQKRMTRYKRKSKKRNSKKKTTAPASLEPVSVNLNARVCRGLTSLLKQKVHLLHNNPWTKVERFKAVCDFGWKLEGNSQNNFIDLGPSNHQRTIKGGEGSDTYVVNYGYSKTIIDNFAEDEKLDKILFGATYDRLIASKDKNTHLKITAYSGLNDLTVIVSDFFTKPKRQHILGVSSDGAMFRFISKPPYKEVLVVDHHSSDHSWFFNVTTQPEFATARVVHGSAKGQNYIRGTDGSVRLVGGKSNDIIYGGPSGELIEGLLGHDHLYGNDGDDTIHGGEGNDKLYGGNGNDIIYGGGDADEIDGGDGFDTLVFKAVDFQTTMVVPHAGLVGVDANLLIGTGNLGEAKGDTFANIESLYGTEYSDTLVGNYKYNRLLGFGGNDYLTTFNNTAFLYGGTGMDVYDISKASGWKVIDNFATDEKEDTVLIPSSVNHYCCLKRGSHLYVSLSPASSNLVLMNYFKNSSYQHVLIKKGNDHIKLSDACQGVCNADAVVQTVWQQNLHVSARTAKSITLTMVQEIDDHCKSCANDKYQVYLVYTKATDKRVVVAAEYSINGQQRKWTSKKNKVTETAHNATTKIVNIEVGALESGTLHAFSVVVYACGHITYASTPVRKRTWPLPPADLKMIKSNKTKKTYNVVLGWKEPQDALGYRYVVRAQPKKTKKKSKAKTVTLVTGKNLFIANRSNFV